MDPNVLMNPAILQAQLAAREAELNATAAKTHFERLANAQQLQALSQYTQPPPSPGAILPPAPPAEEKRHPWFIIVAIVVVAALAGAVYAKNDAGRDHHGYSVDR